MPTKNIAALFLAALLAFQSRAADNLTEELKQFVNEVALHQVVDYVIEQHFGRKQFPPGTSVIDKLDYVSTSPEAERDYDKAIEATINSIADKEEAPSRKELQTLIKEAIKKRKTAVSVRDGQRFEDWMLVGIGLKEEGACDYSDRQVRAAVVMSELLEIVDPEKTRDTNCVANLLALFARDSSSPEELLDEWSTHFPKWTHATEKARRALTYANDDPKELRNLRERGRTAVASMAEEAEKAAALEEGLFDLSTLSSCRAREANLKKLTAEADRRKAERSYKFTNAARLLAEGAIREGAKSGEFLARFAKKYPQHDEITAIAVDIHSTYRRGSLERDVIRRHANESVGLVLLIYNNSISHNYFFSDPNLNDIAVSEFLSDFESFAGKKYPDLAGGYTDHELKIVLCGLPASVQERLAKLPPSQVRDSVKRAQMEAALQLEFSRQKASLQRAARHCGRGRYFPKTRPRAR